jgi:hypothetical protein
LPASPARSDRPIEFHVPEWILAVLVIPFEVLQCLLGKHPEVDGSRLLCYIEAAYLSRIKRSPDTRSAGNLCARICWPRSSNTGCCLWQRIPSTARESIAGTEPTVCQIAESVWSANSKHRECSYDFPVLNALAAASLLDRQTLVSRGEDGLGSFAASYVARRTGPLVSRKAGAAFFAVMPQSRG